MKSENNTKYIIFVSISILMLLIVVSSLTYAYFTAQINGVNDLEVTGNFGATMTPVFTAHNMGDLNLYVSTADMLESNASPLNNTIADQATTTLEVSLIAQTTCTYNIIIESSGSSYVQSPAVSSAGLNEFTFKILDESGNAVLAEKDLSQIIASDASSATMANLSITSTGTMETDTYTIIATMYNLNVTQTIYNNSYAYVIKVADVVCA